MTFLWHVAGSVAGGGGLGALLGAVGSYAYDPNGLSERVAVVVLALVMATGVALDLGAMGANLPTVRRQVNEDWLHRYRGWVYGFGFGLQLGVGFSTVVGISAVYAAFAAAFLSGSAATGLLIGAAFGLVRAGTILTVVTVRRADQLVMVDARLRRWDRPARGLAIAFEGTLLAMAAVAIVM
ncbi:MAG: sulfite exporter TauE/SafE family protein [Actinomycetota bacterium]